MSHYEISIASGTIYSSAFGDKKRCQRASLCVCDSFTFHYFHELHISSSSTVSDVIFGHVFNPLPQVFLSKDSEVYCQLFLALEPDLLRLVRTSELWP